MPTPPPPRLLIDAGNTRVKFGLAIAAVENSLLPECTAFAAVPRNEPLPWEQVQSWLTAEAGSTRAALSSRGASLQGVITGSNPQQIDRVVREWPAEWTTPRVMTDRRELPIAIDVDQPERVGMDRLLNAVAANVLRKPGEPVIVIDVGTATTVDVVSREGAFIGGAIIAGPGLTARALHEYTAVLPHVTLEELMDAEPPVIGRNTVDAIKSGLYWGHWQSVWSYCVRMMDPLGVTHSLQTILTGGAAHLFVSRLSPAHTYLPHLTLQGLAIAAASAERGT